MKPLPERVLLLLLAAVQFTHIMDFMILMPLGPQLMRELSIGPYEFSRLVSAYTLSAGIVGLLVAPFIDRFDRRTLLLTTYAGFIVGTVACALAHQASTLLVARAICGAFGGVSGAVILTIVSDLVPAVRRAAAMGIIMTAFSVAAALGVPFGLYLAQRINWEAPFWLLAGLSLVAWTILWFKLPAVRAHLTPGAGGFRLFLPLLRNANAGWGLLFMGALVFSHFTIIPLLSPYLVHNVGVPEKHLFLVYLVGGVLTVFTLPYVGRLADRHGRWRILAVLVFVACGVTLMLTNAGRLPLVLTLVLGGMFFVFASGRFVPAQAILSLAVPAAQRGAFMSLTACTRDFASGLVSDLGGRIVTQSAEGAPLQNYHYLGWIAIGFSLLSLAFAARVRRVD